MTEVKKRTRPRTVRSEAPRRLIVNADDLGRSTGINDGIFEAHARGIVSSATLMVERAPPATPRRAWRIIRASASGCTSR